MKLGILSRTDSTDTTLLLRGRAATRGWNVSIVKPAEYHLASGTASLAIPLPIFDVILARIGSNSPLENLDMLWAMEGRGIPCVNAPDSILRSRDKVVAHQLLWRVGVPEPKTIRVGFEAPFEDLLTAIPNPPWIVKLAHGAKGVGVMRLDSEASLRSVIDVFVSRRERVLLQEYLDIRSGGDVRVLVLNGEARAAVWRTPALKDFRANRSQGGEMKKWELSREIADIAVRAASALGLVLAGVDIVVTNEGFFVLEVNSSPGLVGFSTTGQDFVVEEVLDLLESTRQ